MAALTRITIKGFKSIRDASIELRNVNVLIGANGAGKSTFVSFFTFIREAMRCRLGMHVGRCGGANGLLFFGAKHTPKLSASLEFQEAEDRSVYSFTAAYTAQDGLVFEEERVDHGSGLEPQVLMTSREGARRGITESQIIDLAADVVPSGRDIWQHLTGSRVYQFDDTSETSGIRRASYIDNNRWLERDGANLASVLFRMKRLQPDAFLTVVRTIEQIAPWFREFVIEPLELNPKNVQLDWLSRDPDFLFGPHQLPDGALRGMALITLLRQPREYLPRILVIDEPELGLHPHAMTIIAALVKGAAHHCQIILATQSPYLLDQFDPEDVVVVEHDGRESAFRRLDPEELKEWLEDYTLSELWEKNVIGGGPG